MWRVVRYEEAMSSVWNDFVRESRNGTFLLDRGYMDYHSERFDDCSWLAYKGNRLMALLPANLTDDGVIHSHSGLTYGGWILPPSHLDGADVLHIFETALSAWRKMNIKGFDYKTIPYIYHRQPSQDDIYSLFRLGAKLTECNLSATIDLRNPGRFNKLQRRHLDKSIEIPYSFEVVEDIEAFMDMLEECLHLRHEASPVHTAAEMKLLRDRFPDNIRFYAIVYEEEMHAGVCMYDTGTVAHAQYIATTETGGRLNLLTPLFHRLINNEFCDRHYFDFGTSNEEHGLVLNEGLLRQKYSYGATGTVYNRYFIEL